MKFEMEKKYVFILHLPLGEPFSNTFFCKLQRERIDEFVEWREREFSKLVSRYQIEVISPALCSLPLISLPLSFIHSLHIALFDL